MPTSRSRRRPPGLRRLGTLAVAALAAGVITGGLLGLLAGLLLALGVPAAAQPVAPVGAFGWPLQPGPPQVLTPFRAPSHPYGPGHRGVDLAGSAGQPVLAAGDGVVAFADVLAGRGVVSVEHPGGLRTTYEPVDPAVRAGQPVRRGEPLGRLSAGHPTCAPVVCLHWGLRRARAEGFEYLDPLRLIRHRVRLLPSNGAP